LDTLRAGQDGLITYFITPKSSAALAVCWIVWHYFIFHASYSFYIKIILKLATGNRIEHFIASALALEVTNCRFFIYMQTLDVCHFSEIFKMVRSDCHAKAGMMRAAGKYPGSRSSF